jgi:hypothetical protein
MTAIALAKGIPSSPNRVYCRGIAVSVFGCGRSVVVSRFL